MSLPRIRGAPTDERRYRATTRAALGASSRVGLVAHLGDLHEHALAGAGVDSVVCFCDLLER